MGRVSAFAPTPPGSGRSRAPHGYGSMKVSDEQAAHLNRLALEVFTEMANTGAPFADCLGSVLLTGMEFARETLNKKEGAT